MKALLLRIGTVLFVVVPGSVLLAQTATTPWVVRPAWIKAHEDFLASDAMRGRGSATHDEEVAAAYVASEFEGYGLQPAPGMAGFIQSVPLDEVVLDGHAQLSAGKVSGTEGADFDLYMSGGVDVSGQLIRVDPAKNDIAKIKAGEIVLVSRMPEGPGAGRLLGALYRSGAPLILLPAESQIGQSFLANGRKTRLPLRVEGDASRPSPTMVLLHAATLGAMASLPEGATVSLQVHRVSSPPRTSYNAIGYLQGSDPSAGTLLLSAHLDHLGVGRPVNGDALYNGANDDASGTTAVLELAHALAAGTQPRRSVLFVCYGSEELGELGSTYFGQHSPVPIRQLVANLEFEMIGNQDPKMPKNTLLLTGWERSNLGPVLKQHGALLGPDPYPEEHFFERSDNYSLALEGVVAHTAAGWGTPPTYHQPNDDLGHVDLPFMTAAIQSLVEPVRWLASSDFVPAWKPDGRPGAR